MGILLNCSHLHIPFSHLAKTSRLLIQHTNLSGGDDQHMSIQVDVKPANAHSLDSEPWWHDTLKTLRPTSKVELDSIDATRLRGVPLVVSPAQTKMSSIQAFKSNRDLFAAVCRALAQLDQGLLIHAPSASGHYQMQWLFHCTAPSVPGGSDGGATAVLQQLVRLILHCLPMTTIRPNSKSKESAKLWLVSLWMPVLPAAQLA